MQSTIKVLLCCAICFGGFINASAQDVQKLSFKDGIKGVHFDQISIHQTTVLPDGGVRVFLALRRKGAVQEKKLVGWEGGGNEVMLTALGVIDFSKDMKVTNETLSFDTPKGVSAKEFNILSGTLKSTIPETIATQKDCVKSQGEWVKMFPELQEKQSSNQEEGAKPGVFYNNSIVYGGLALKPQKFVSEKNTLVGPADGSGEKADKTFFQLLWDGGDAEGNTAKYVKDEIDVAFNPYRGSTKKDYWQRGSESVCDPVSGNVLAHHYRVVFGEYNNRSQLFLGELVAFNAKGEELNRTELTFKKPMSLQTQQAFFDGEGSAASLRGLVHVYAEVSGFGFKKLNPNPDPLARKLYHWNNAGKLLMQVDFAAPEEKANCVRAFEAGGGVTVLMATSLNLFSLFFKDGKLVSTEKVDLKAEIAKGMELKASDLQNAQFRPRSTVALSDGSTLYFLSPYWSQKGTQVGAPTIQKYRGLLISHVGMDGKLLHLRGLERLPSSDYSQGHGFYLFSENKTHLGFSFLDSQRDGSQQFSIYRLNLLTFQLTEVFSAPVGKQQRREYIDSAGMMMMCYFNSNDKAYELVLIKP